jgi:hypothetical protein
MAQNIINYGATANDGQGDPLRTAFIKTDENFSQIWAAGPVGSNVTIINNTVGVTNTNGNLILSPNGIGIIQTNNHIVPRANRTYDIGSANLTYRTVYANTATFQTLGLAGDLSVGGNLTVTGNTIQIGNITTETKTIQLANAASTANAANGSGVTVGANDNIATLLYNSAGNVWTTNIGVSAVGNVTAPYFIGNGSQLTGLPASYGNANVASFLSSFGSNTISTTGNVTVGNILPAGYVSATGNVRGANFNTVGTVSATGNISGNYFIGNGSQLTGVAATGNLDIVGTTISIANGAPETYINLSANVEGWAYVQVPNDATANVYDTRIHNDAGNIEFGSGNASNAGPNYTWKLDNTGNLNLPNNGDINFNGGGLQQVVNEDFYIRASDDESDGWSIYNVVDDGTGNILSQTRLEFDQYTIRTDAQGASYTWAFRDTGVLELPGDIYGNVGGNLTVKIGDQAGSNTFIDLQTRSYTGDALISNIRIANPDVTISTASAAYNWIFDGTNGFLTFPRDASNVSTDPYLVIEGGGTPSIQVVDASETGPGNLGIVSNYAEFSGYNGNTVTVYADEGQISSSYNLQLQTPSGIPNSTANINSQGGYNIGSYTGLSTTGGSGTGLTVNASTAGNGYINTVTINNPGSGYTNGDTITIVGGDGFGCTFTVGVSANNWTFTTTGNLNLPIGGKVVGQTADNNGYITWLGNSSGDLNGYTTMRLVPDDTTEGGDQYLIIDPTAPGHIHIRAGGTQDNSGADLFLGGENSYFRVASGANSAASVSANSYVWTYGTDGTFSLPAAESPGQYSEITSVGNSSGDGYGYATLQLKPDTSLSGDSYLIIDPTAPNHIHIRAGGAQDNSGAQLFLGGENSYFLVENGANSNVYVASNSNQWKFDTTGQLALPTISLSESTDEQTVIGSQRKLIPPFRWSAVISGTTPTVVYNATDVNTTSMKVTMQIQHSGLGMEFFEVFATFTGSDTYYTVSNRVAPPTIDASTVVVGLGAGNTMKITVTINSGAGTSWVTYDAVEFGIPND